MNILHLASFSGNIGDNAQINGLKNILRKDLAPPLTYHPLEIRSFYQSRKDAYFNSELAQSINQYDLFLIGGGGFFEMNFPQSTTGTTLDWNDAFIEQIEIPMVFYGLGCNQLSEPHPACIDSFITFLSKLRKKNNVLISVRNDGSKEAIQQYVPQNISDTIYEIPDSGFYFKPNPQFQNRNHPLLPENSLTLAICLAGDELIARYKDPSNAATSLAKELSQALEITPHLHIIFFPHIHKDISYAYHVIEQLPDKHRRNRVHTAPCFQGEKASQFLFHLYSRSQLVLSNRFHGVVVPLSLQRPTLPLCDFASRKIKSLSHKLNLHPFSLKSGLPFHGLSSILTTELENPQPQLTLQQKHIIEMRQKSAVYNEQISKLIANFQSQ